MLVVIEVKGCVRAYYLAVPFPIRYLIECLVSTRNRAQRGKLRCICVHRSPVNSNLHVSFGLRHYSKPLLAFLLMTRKYLSRVFSREKDPSGFKLVLDHCEGK